MFTPALSPLPTRRTRPAASTLGSGARQAVPPPSLRHAPPARGWQRALAWLLAPVPGDTAPAPDRLSPVRDEFHDCTIDLTAVPDAGQLVRSIDVARTLREFWHLRAEVYRLVAVQYSQAEAETRLARLNRHFPTRSPRSGFAPL
jgi:hypothetical protein